MVPGSENGGQVEEISQPLQASDFDSQPDDNSGQGQQENPNPELGDQSQVTQEGGEQVVASQESTMFKSIDGRDLTPEQFQQEYRQLAGEFTRRSQELSRLEKEAREINNRPDYSGLSPEQREAREVLDGITREAVAKAKSEITPMIEEMRIKSEIADLQTKYPDFDPESVIPFAINSKILDLESAYKIMNFESKIEAAKKEAQNATLTNIQRRGPQAGIPAQTDSSAPAKGGLLKYDHAKDAGKSPRQLLDEAFAEMGL